jgi:alpha-amylase
MQVLGALFNAVLGALMTALMVLVVVLSEEEPGGALTAPGAQPEPSLVVAAADGPRTAIVELFEWRWDDVAEECEAVLGPAGFDAVQVSPPNEHRLVAGYPWWQRYQPVSDLLESRGGDAEAFASMVRRCADAGIKVYADVVLNHMTGERLADDPLWGKGSAGSPYDYKQYPNFGPEDFHAPACEIEADFSDRAVVQRCAHSGRADLNTAADSVQDRLGAFLNALLAVGVSGFHLDGAVHMAAADIAGILARVQGLPFVVQEVLDKPGEPIRADEYLANGLVTEFEYGHRVAAALRYGGLSTLRELELGAGDLLPSERALVFIDTHRTQRAQPGTRVDGAILSWRDGALYELANIFMLAWPFGTPRIMSSYAFADVDAGPPSRDDGITLRVHGAQGLGCGADWICEHRRPATLAMVRFRNATHGLPVTRWWNDEAAERIAFGRGDLGFVVINNAPEPMRQRLDTGLPAGSYCNLADSERVGEVCVPLKPGEQEGTGGGESIPNADPVLVDGDGMADLSVPPRAAVVLLAPDPPAR